jgi:TrmH family RNA methyltransferase
MGSLFRVNVVSVPDLADTLKNSFKDFEIYTGTMNSKTKLNTISVGKKFGLVFGNEGNGISEPVKKVVKKSFTITGVGSTESLNVAVACGISLAHFVTANKK